MWIKICGLNTADAVAAALDARVQAIGFVFAASVRRVDPALAATLARPARGRALCVAVTRHPDQADIDAMLARFVPDVLQSDLEDFTRLRLPEGLARLPVLRSGATAPEALPGRCLYEGPVSGTGSLADWDQARALAGRCELVLAGGLDAANVATAIRAVRPFGVDVSSGVELRPGVKTGERIEAFARAARAAFLETEQ